MADEYKALVDNGTWRLVLRPPEGNVVTGKWFFKHKFHSDGTLARHKARWVVRGFTQQHGVDYDETQSGGETSHHLGCPQHRRFSQLAHSSTGCQECFSQWSPRGKSLLPAAIWFRSSSSP
jgi:hypothetical protein